MQKKENSEQESNIKKYYDTESPYYSTHVEPNFARAQESISHSVKFAENGIKMMFLLNGGALLALPTLNETFFGDDLSINDTAPFIIGLASVIVATFCGYFNWLEHAHLFRIVANQKLSMFRHDFYVEEINKIRNQPERFPCAEEQIKDLNESREKHRNDVGECAKNIDKSDRIINITFRAGVVSAAVSGLCFMFGCLSLMN